MNISLGQELLTEADHIEDLVIIIIERLKKHPVFESHKDNVFGFVHVSLDKITKETKSLDVKKACKYTDIAT